MSFHQLGNIESETVREKFSAYPEDVLPTMLFLRETIFNVAGEHDIGPVEETLKWNEPAYLANTGSTIRVNWDKGQYRIYFNCRSKLVATFKEIYPDTFDYHNLRAIYFADIESIKAVLPELKHCIKLSLIYHRVKHLPLLGN